MKKVLAIVGPMIVTALGGYVAKRLRARNQLTTPEMAARTRS